MSTRHTPATRRIQARLERLELEHLRVHAAELAAQIEDLTARVERLTQSLSSAEDSAEFWRQSHHELVDHLDDGSEDARCIGLTMNGELLVVRTGAPS